MGDLNYLVAIGAGVASFITPCVLPMVPVYLGIISGVSIDQMKSGKKYLSKVFFASFLFVLGFTTVFAMLGLAVGFLANSFYKAVFNLVLGIIIIIFGLHYTRILPIPFLDKQAKFNTKKGSSVFHAYLIGFLFAFGWTPCIGPILGSILALPANKYLVKVSYTLAYSMGLAIPFLISSIAINAFFKLFDKIKAHFHKIEIAIGIFLFILGSYYVANVFITGDILKSSPTLKISSSEIANGIDFKIQLQSGETKSLISINAKLYVVNIWTTWCPNCLDEMPDLIRINNKYKSKGLYLIGLCAEDSSSTLDEYNMAVKRLSINFDTHFDKTASILSYLKEVYKPSKAISGYPVTYVLDKNRKVVKFVIGAKNFKSWDKIIGEYLN
jgi:cytochrome c-type biogenesis protein